MWHTKAIGIFPSVNFISLWIHLRGGLQWIVIQKPFSETEVNMSYFRGMINEKHLQIKSLSGPCTKISMTKATQPPWALAALHQQSLNSHLYRLELRTLLYGNWGGNDGTKGLLGVYKHVRDVLVLAEVDGGGSLEVQRQQPSRWSRQYHGSMF